MWWGRFRLWFRMWWGMAVVPVMSFRVSKRWCISIRYSAAVSKWRRGRKYGEIRWHPPPLLHQLRHEPSGCIGVAPGLDEDVEDVAVLVDGRPQVLPYSADLHEHLVTPDALRRMAQPRLGRELGACRRRSGRWGR